MQSLLNIAAFYFSTPDLYKFSKISVDDYYVEPNDRSIKAFKIKKMNDKWIAEGGYSDFQAAQLGQLIEKRFRGVE